MQGSDKIFSIDEECWEEERSYHPLVFCSDFFITASAFSHHPYHYTHVSGPPHVCRGLRVPEAVTEVAFCPVGTSAGRACCWWCPAAPCTCQAACRRPGPTRAHTCGPFARPNRPSGLWKTPWPSSASLSLGAQLLSAAGPPWGSLLMSKARARLPVPLQKMLFNHKNKKTNKTKTKKKSSSVHKCSDLISEGGQRINPCVDGLKNESEHLVAPVTGSHISYELWHPRVCPVLGCGSGSVGAAGWMLQPGRCLGTPSSSTPQPVSGAPGLSSGFAQICGCFKQLRCNHHSVFARSVFVPAARKFLW